MPSRSGHRIGGERSGCSYSASDDYGLERCHCDNLDWDGGREVVELFAVLTNMEYEVECDHIKKIRRGTPSLMHSTSAAICYTHCGNFVERLYPRSLA
jgi:hypothetical protein